jgi:hypothetical protein
MGVSVPVDSRLVFPRPAWWSLSTNQEHSNRIILRRFSGYNPSTMFTVHLFYTPRISTHTPARRGVS